MVSMAAAAKIAVLLAVAALFATAGADDPQAKKEAGCWQCYSTCMDKCDSYPNAPLRSANRTEPAAHIAVDGGAAAATGTAHSTDGAVANVSDSYDDKGDDEDEDDNDKDKDKDKDKNKDKDKDDDDEDEDEDEDDDDDDNSHSSNGGKDYFTCKKKCIVDCYKDLPPVCYKMCIAETCLKLPPHKQGGCFKACGHKCFHKPPGPKPGPPKPKPKPTPPKPKPPTPPKPTPTPTPPKPTPTPPKPTPPQQPPCPKRCPPKPKPPPKHRPPCPPAAKKAPEAKGSHVSLPCARPGGCRPEQATNDTRNGNTNN